MGVTEVKDPEWPRNPKGIIEEALREYVGDGDGHDVAVLNAFLKDYLPAEEVREEGRELTRTIERQRALLNNADTVNTELMLEVANARANVALESDLLAANERLGALVDQQLGPCVGCFEAPEEHCPRHGRSYTDMLESMGRIVDWERNENSELRQTIDDQAEEIANCKILKYEAVLDSTEETCGSTWCGWRNAIYRMREIRNG